MAHIDTSSERSAVTAKWTGATLLVATLSLVAGLAIAADPWHVERGSGGASDAKQIVVGGDSTNEWKSAASSGHATLMFGCEGDFSIVVVDLHEVVGTEHPQKIAITYRVDDEKAIHEQWAVAADLQRILSPASLELLAKLLKAKRLRVEVPWLVPAGSTWTADFDLSSNGGFAVLARQVAKDCGMEIPR